MDRFLFAVPLAAAGALMCAMHADAGLVITQVVTEGDAIAGVGNAEVPAAVAVNNAGDTLVETDTDAATTADLVVLLNGSVFLREGDSLSDPVGATVSSVGPVHINAAGDVGWNVNLNGVDTNLNSGVFFNTTLLIQESDISTAPQFSAGTPYIGFFQAHMNDSNRMLVIASIDDPAIATTVDRALVLVDYDAKANSFTETVLAKEGDTLPGQTETVADFATGVHGSDLNNAGQALFLADLNGATATDLVLYRDATLLLQEGDPSPIAGRNFNLSTSTPVSMNDDGDWAIRTTLTGDTASDAVIVFNGTIVAQEGQPAPGTTETFTGFGTSTAVMLGNDDEVVYFATLSGDAAQNQALYKGDQLLLRKGVTLINGQTLTNISGTVTTGIGEGFNISPDGRYVIVRVVYADGNRGVILIDTQPPADCPADITGDNNVGVADLLAVISAWGPCPAPPQTCPEDVAPAGSPDGAVGVADLLFVISNWGACP